MRKKFTKLHKINLPDLGNSQDTFRMSQKRKNFGIFTDRYFNLSAICLYMVHFALGPFSESRDKTRNIALP